VFGEQVATRKVIGDVDIVYHDELYHLFHLVLPNHDFIAHAGISRDVLVVGVGEKLEIWDRATYAARGEEQRENRRRATARRGQFGGGEA